MLINSVYPHLWPTTASRLEGLTIIKQCVYQMAFRNEFKKRLEKSGLAWSRTSSTVLSMHVEIISLPAFAQCANISSNFTADSWKRKHLDEMRANVSKMWTKWVFVRYLDYVIILLVLHFPGSAETDVGWGGKLNCYLMASCLRNICTENY